MNFTHLLFARLLACSITTITLSAYAQVTSWDNSPYNYNNSPLNYQNSPLNYNSNNGVYDNSGNRIGYEVKAPSGVTNVFDNSGNRMGYSPAGTRK